LTLRQQILPMPAELLHTGNRYSSIFQPAAAAGWLGFTHCAPLSGSGSDIRCPIPDCSKRCARRLPALFFRIQVKL